MGAEVYSGTLNHHGVLHVRATKRTQESTLSQIGKLVEDAQGSRAQLQLTTDRLAAYFVPFVAAVAVVVFLAWYITALQRHSSDPLSFALRIAIAVLVVACPCALALAVPTAAMVAVGVGAKSGILLKGGGEVLENLNKVNVVAFDKTGTLTRGTPSVVGGRVQGCSATDPRSCAVDPCPCTGGKCTCAIAWYNTIFFAAHAESLSEHPLGKAIVKYAKEQFEFAIVPPTDFTSVAGKGVVCEVKMIHIYFSVSL